MPDARRASADARHRAGGGTGRAARRAVAVLLVLGAWVAVAGTGGPLVGRLSEVQRNDNASFLPADAESTRAARQVAGFTASRSLPFFVLVEHRSGLGPADTARVQAWAAGVGSLRIPVAGRPAVPVSRALGDEPVVPVPSQDGQALLVRVGLDPDVAARNLPDGTSYVYGVAQALRTSLADRVAGDGGQGGPGGQGGQGGQGGSGGPGLRAAVGGPAGLLADFVTAFSGIDGRLLQVTLGVVFLILLLVYRSPLLPVAALVAALFALSAAGAVIYPLARAGTIDLNGQSQGILFILVVGSATDYALLLVSRYREELHVQTSKYAAMRRAWRAAVEPIAASAATVVLGLLCLLLADLGSTRGLGPVGALGIAGSLVSVLTLLPVALLLPVVLLVLLGTAAGAGAGAALGAAAGAPLAGALSGAALALAFAVVLAAARGRALRRSPERVPDQPAAGARLPWYARPESGRWLFWPRVPHVDGVRPGAAIATGDERGAQDAAGARGLWARVAALVGRRPRAVWVLTLTALLALAAFVPQFAASGVRQTDVFRSPVQSVTAQAVLERHFAAGSGSPALVLAPEADLARVLDVTTRTRGVTSAAVTPAAPSAPGAAPGAPPGPAKVVDGRVQVQAVLTSAADSPAAEDVVQTLRTRLDAVGTDVLVGGTTATNLDVRAASGRDLRVIIPTVLAVILVVLALLLRSLVAPLLLVVANVVSFGATIGASALAFGRYGLDLPGGDPAIPLYGFVFLVALGIDYSIFLMTRVREESAVRGTRPGTLVGLAVTGGVITSAGVVLASTFGALATIPILFLLQVAFIVAFGVLLDTLVVRSLLVPAAVYDLGPRVWWPSRLGRR